MRHLDQWARVCRRGCEGRRSIKVGSIEAATGKGRGAACMVTATCMAGKFIGSDKVGKVA